MLIGRLVQVADTKIYVDERGPQSAFPVLVFHGGPGLDHTWFADYLDPLTDDGGYRLVLVHERACGRSDRTAPPQTWTLERMAQDVSDLAVSLGVNDGYATLGHSYGAFVVLQHAVDHPGEPRGTIVSGGIAATRWLEHIDRQLATFEPIELRQQVTSSWAREIEVRTQDEASALLEEQMPFHFRDPQGGALKEYLDRTAGLARYAPDVIRHFAARSYGWNRGRRPARRGDPSGASTGRPPRSNLRRRRVRGHGRPAAQRRTCRVGALRPHDVRRGARSLPGDDPPLPHRITT
jgi:proline iminopeptidase